MRNLPDRDPGRFSLLDTRDWGIDISAVIAAGCQMSLGDAPEGYKIAVTIAIPGGYTLLLFKGGFRAWMSTVLYEWKRDDGAGVRRLAFGYGDTATDALWRLRSEGTTNLGHAWCVPLPGASEPFTGDFAAVLKRIIDFTRSDADETSLFHSAWRQPVCRRAVAAIA